MAAKKSSKKLVSATAASKPPGITAERLNQIGTEIGDVASMLNSALLIARGFKKEDAAGLEALLEKAGFVADRLATELGDGPMLGPWECWANVGKESEAAA